MLYWYFQWNNKMDSAVFILVLVATWVTMTTSVTIKRNEDTVTIRHGEALRLSCHISTNPSTDVLSEVRWYRSQNITTYGYIDVSRGCSTVCQQETFDNRGIIRYDRGTSNEATSTMTINSSTVIDNTTFSCGVLKVDGTSQTSDTIYVIVYVPDVTTTTPDRQITQDRTFPTTATITNASDTTTMDISLNQPTIKIDQYTTPIKTTPDGPYSTSTPSITASQLTTTVIVAVAVSACVVIILLLVIIACLVSSRKRRLINKEPMLSLRLSLNVTSVEIRTTNTQEGDGYDSQRYQDTCVLSRQQDTMTHTGRQHEERPTSKPPQPIYEDKDVYAEVGPGTWVGPMRSSTRDDEEEGTLVENILYAPCTEIGM